VVGVIFIGIVLVFCAAFWGALYLMARADDREARAFRFRRKWWQ
jgi:hypothetical protein